MRYLIVVLFFGLMQGFVFVVLLEDDEILFCLILILIDCLDGIVWDVDNECCVDFKVEIFDENDWFYVVWELVYVGWLVVVGFVLDVMWDQEMV